MSASVSPERARIIPLCRKSYALFAKPIRESLDNSRGPQQRAHGNNCKANGSTLLFADCLPPVHKHLSLILCLKSRWLWPCQAGTDWLAVIAPQTSSLKAFANETFVADPGGGLRAAAFAPFVQRLAPHIGQEAPNITSALNFVAAGLGISFVPASLHHLRIDGVTLLPAQGWCATDRSPEPCLAPGRSLSRRGHFLSLVKVGGKKLTQLKTPTMSPKPI